MGHSRSTHEELMGERAIIADQIDDLQRGIERIDWVIARMFPPTPNPREAHNGTDNVSRAELMERVMTGQGALKTKDVLRLLSEHGFISDQGRVTYNRVCATLAQSPRFERVATGMYKVAEARSNGGESQDGKAQEEEEALECSETATDPDLAGILP